MEMHKSGIGISDIASRLNMSYSAVYHWVKGLRKPGHGNIKEFESAVLSGPVAAAEIKDEFPKHNELFLISAKRGLPLKRYMMGRRYGEYSTWYFAGGQEEKLKERLKEFFAKYKELREKLIESVVK